MSVFANCFGEDVPGVLCVSWLLCQISDISAASSASCILRTSPVAEFMVLGENSIVFLLFFTEKEYP